MRGFAVSERVWSWTGEHTFIQEVTVHCRAGHRCWIMATAPLLRSTGDFTLKLANTTWHLRDVYFDTPDPNGPGAYKVNSVPTPRSLAAPVPG